MLRYRFERRRETHEPGDRTRQSTDSGVFID